MTTFIRLALKSALSRKVTLLLTIFSLSVSMMLLIGVDKIRKEARNGFMNTLSQTDLIVGARSGPLNLLLYSVFRIGNATNNISWDTYTKISSDRWVQWSVPISLGDSHRGYRVMGTTQEYFSRYKYADGRSLALSGGRYFSDIYEAVLGWETARKLGYKVGDRITLSHGLADTSFTAHKDKPFTVTGILKPTGTPVDRTIHTPLEGIEALHIDYRSGVRMPYKISAKAARAFDLQPKAITAFMVGLTSRVKTFRMQRKINEYSREPLTAIIPGATLATLWQTLESFEKVLMVIAFFVLVTALIGMVTTLLSTLNERRREMAVLRSVGAHPYHILLLFAFETALVMVMALIVAVAMLYGLILIFKPLLLDHYGLYITVTALDLSQWMMVAGALAVGLLFSLIPGWIAYRRSLQDGLQLKF